MPLPTGPKGGLPGRPSGLPPVQPPRGPSLPQPPQAAPTPLPPTPVAPTPAPAAPPQTTRLSQYDFDSQRVTPPVAPQVPQAPTIPETSFDQQEAALAEETRLRRERETQERFDRSMDDKKPAGKIKNNALSPQAGDLDEKGQNVFVDKKSKKLRPFGGKKAIKVSDLDKRKNVRQQARVVQGVIIGLLVLILGFGVKNAFWPPASLSQDDVLTLVAQTTGNTGFPTEEGASFAQQYAKAYMTAEGKESDASAVLSFYKTGALNPGGAADYLVTDPTFNSTVIYGPFVYKSTVVSANASNFVVGGLLKITEATAAQGSYDANGNLVAGSTPAEELQWRYYSINVYYDSDKDAFAIQGVPSVVPAPAVTTELPDNAPLGTGEAVENTVLATITPTVYGFLEAYRTSSESDYSALTPWIGDDPDPTMLTGMDEAYEFKGGKANTDSVKLSAFTGTAGEIKVLATVTWTTAVGAAEQEIQSQYVVTLVPITGASFEVVKFAPYLYTPVVETASE